MEKRFDIGGRDIGEGAPLFITAECGVTCNYDMKIARELVDVVSESGADAIKLLMNFPDEVMSDRQVLYTYETVAGKKTVNMFDMFEKLRFTFEQWKQLKAYADAKDVTLYSTVSCPPALDYAKRLGFELTKISSWDYNHPTFWHDAACLGKPMLMDTGAVSMGEIAKALDVIRAAGNEKGILVYCYHTCNPSEKNMLSLPYMRKTFDALVGFSSPGIEDEQDIMAVSLGAVSMEKRLTMSQNLPGHHHVLSLEPGQFKKWVSKIREIHQSLGVEDLIPSPADLADRKNYFRHLVANREIPAGTILKAADIAAKRPEEGISPEYFEKFIGKKTNRPLKYNEALTWDVI